MVLTSMLPAVARMAAVAYFGMTSVYCLLMFIPFTHVQLLEPGLLEPLVIFERVHPWLLLPVLALSDAGLGAAPLPPAAIVLRLGYRVVLSVAGLLLLLNPLLARLDNDIWSLVWSQLSLVPLLWLSMIDLVAARGRIVWSRTTTGGERRLLTAVFAATLFAWGTSALVATGRSLVSVPSMIDLSLGLVWSLATHLVLFIGICTTLLLIQGVASMTKRSARSETLAFGLALTCLIASIIRYGFYSSMAFDGALADLAAVTLSVTLVLSVASGALRKRAEQGAPVDDGIGFVLSQLAPFPERSVRLGLAWMAGLALVTWVAMTNLVAIDWNQLFQKIVVVQMWLLALAAAYAIARPRSRSIAGLGVWVAVSLIATGGFRVIEPVAGYALNAAGREEVAAASLARYTEYDVAAGLLAGLLETRSRSVDADDVELFRYLQDSTGIPRSVPLPPREVRFVPDPSVPSRTRPHIFVMMVDSLRRDYLGAYNPDVTFTPHLDRFAAENLPFERAYSRYGATGLSVASFWIGGLSPHKQYVTPFGPMNALQSLLKGQGYLGHISLFPLLRHIIDPVDSWVEDLHPGLPVPQYDLCGSLDEFERRLAQSDGRPQFMYAQPQNVHVATIAREGRSPVDEASYHGFYAPVASRLRRMDRCFGEFIDHLKVLGAYNDSIIVFTSDHGDSLGEGGRMGHAYTIFPEILRIPLIMRVPDALRADLLVDTRGLTFTTDLVPSFYTLMGFDPERKSHPHGRSLFVRDLRDRADYVAADHLVVSSYGPVYGVIEDAGQSLYIVDAVNYRDHLYDLTSEDVTATLPINDARRRSSRAKVDRLVVELNEWYRVPVSR